MSFLTHLFNSADHCEDSTAYLLTELDVKFTDTNFKKQLIEHPDYPSLMSIADVIGTTYNIASIPLRIQADKILSYSWMQLPFVAHLKTEKNTQKSFGVVTHFSPEAVELYDPISRNKEKLSFHAFDNRFLGTILAVEKQTNAIEKDYTENIKLERRKNFQSRFLLYAIPILTLLLCLQQVFINNASHILIPVLFTTLTLFGCVISVLLLWHDVDSHNPALKQICQSGKKINCAAVLDSKASTIFGVSWSSIGFSYFFGMFIYLLISGIPTTQALGALSWVNILASPYILFSIFYQWKIAKQWCMLCLAVQVILLGQLLLIFTGGYPGALLNNQLSGTAVFSIVPAFSLAFGIILLFLPITRRLKELNKKTQELQRVKNNPQVFEALLPKQKPVDLPSKDLGIILGNPDGKIRVVKICNPFCRPCGESHPILEALAENNDQICLQIVFNVNKLNFPIVKDIINHFLIIDSLQDKSLTKNALNDWYTHFMGDYPGFVAKYPLESLSNFQGSKIDKMEYWCESVGVSYTPTFFICIDTGITDAKTYQMPVQYAVNDLSYFLTT